MIIGIDLGTTNSAAAYVDHDGRPRLVRAAGGSHTLPSIFAIDDKGREVVGFEARRQWQLNPHNTVYGAKRLIGRQFDEGFIERLRKHITFELVEGSGGAVEVVLQNKQYTLADISAKLLGANRDLGEDHLQQKVTAAVVTVPAYYDDLQRQSVKAAGLQVGMEINRIINEPTAAALAYGMDKARGDKTIAVYDLGGGTFDISIIEVADVDGETQFEVLATNGDTFLGGEDFDRRLIDYLADEFKKDQGMDLRGDALAMQRLKEGAEKAKIELSSSSQTEVNLPFITADASGPKHLNLKLTRVAFEAMVEELVQRTRKPCEDAMKDAGVSASEIDEIVVVGGQTRMPRIREFVKQVFGKEPNMSVNPDEVVAIGAAIQGGVLQGDVRDVLLLDVTPLTLAIETAGEVATAMIERNTTIPSKKSQGRRLNRYISILNSKE